MIVVSSSMPKAGSGWYFNLTQDLLVAAGHPATADIRERDKLHDILRHKNCALANLKMPTFERLEKSCEAGQIMVVKTHRAVNKPLANLIESGRAQATYIYRDPRDVVVSLLDHGRRMREDKANLQRMFGIGPYKNFAKLHTARGALWYLKLRVVPEYKRWAAFPNVLMVKYEDLLTDCRAELDRLAEHLNVDPGGEAMDAIVTKYQPSDLDATKAESLHINKAVAGRFLDDLSTDDVALVNKVLGPVVRQMGYPMDPRQAVAT